MAIVERFIEFLSRLTRDGTCPNDDAFLKISVRDLLRISQADGQALQQAYARPDGRN